MTSSTTTTTTTTTSAKPTLDISIPTVSFAFAATRCHGIDSTELDHETNQDCRSLADHSQRLTPSYYDLHHNDLPLSPSSVGDLRYDEADIVSTLQPTLIAKNVSIRSRGFSLSRYHTISESILEEEDMADNAAIETAPNSPPELSYSKSSKSSSSSLRSSSLDDRDDDSASDSLHFEELSLDELGRGSLEAHVIEDNNLKPESRPTLRRPSSRTTPPYRTTPQQSPQYFPQSSYMERRLSPQAAHGSLQDSTLNMPAGRMMRRGFTSRSTPDIHANVLQRRPSDNSAYSGSMPPSPASTTPRASHDGMQSFPHPPIKRLSFQSARKTVKQLEAEYNDDDEEVPDEAILENVPFSPIPGMLQRDSRTPSPRRPPLSPSYTNLHSAKVPKNARRPSAPPVRSPRSPHLRRPPTLQHSNTMPEAPTYARKQRAHSWNDDLNDEARQLSAALEQHAEKMMSEKQGSAIVSTPNSPRRQSDISRKSSIASIVELPPVQKSNIMIDPLPVSKEKEAVLTRTRPSWLPPKSQKEEKKHLKEWQQMMARAAAAEKKRVSKDQDVVEQRQQIGRDSVWEYDILVNWETAKDEIRTKELCWNGIAAPSRGAVWTKAIGNELSLTATSFQAALNRARALEERLDGLATDELSRSKEAAWFSAIDRDVPSVYPALNKFAAGTPANQALSDVLKAYAMYRSDVGYVYGTHLVAGLLCLYLRPADAFVTLANLLNRPIPLAFLIHDQSAMAKARSRVLDVLKRKHSKLYAHLTDPALDLMPEEYLDPMFRCLFAYNLNTDEVSRFWDVYAFEGDNVLVHAAVAILGLLESKLYSSKKEIVALIGWRNQKCWDFGEEALVAAIRDVKS